MWSAKPNEPLRTNCEFCGEFTQPGHLCAQKHDAQLTKDQEAAAAKQAAEGEDKFRRQKDAREKARLAHLQADARVRLNYELAKLAGLPPAVFAERQREMDRTLIRYYEGR